MPSADWFETLPFDEVSHENAERVHALMRYIYLKKIPAKRLISSLCRGLQLYNFSILHTSISIQNNEMWPIQKAVDPFSFYIYPESATSIDEALLLFEDVIIPYQVYDSFVNHNDIEHSLYTALKVEDLQTPQWPYHFIERLAYRGLSFPASAAQPATVIAERLETARTTTSEQLLKQSQAFVALTKVNFRVGATWYYAVLCNNLKQPQLVRLDEEESLPRYRWANSRPLAGEFYTNGDLKAIPMPIESGGKSMGILTILSRILMSMIRLQMG